MKRILSLFLCAILILGLFTGCRDDESAYIPTGDALDNADSTVTPEQNDPDQETSVTLAYDPDSSLNPLQSTSYTNRVLFSLIYQGLFAVSRDYTVSPILCQSYNVSADMKTYTFYLAEASFSDGTPLTPADVVASLTAAQESPYYGGRLQHMLGVSSYGDAVVVELDTSMENLPLLLDIPIVKASEVNASQPLGTGPYRLDGTQLRRQAGWWCNAALGVQSNVIRLVEAGTPSELRDAFEFEDTSLVCTDPGSKDYVDFHSDYELWDCENGLFLYLVVNADSEIFSNDVLRSALTHAIDRDTLVTKHYHSFAYSAALPASPLSPNYNTTLASHYSYDPQAFRDALEAAELTDTAVTLLVNTADSTRSAAARSIAAMLQEYGLTVTITEATADTFQSMLQKGEYDLYLAQTRLSANMDISAFFGMSTSLNYGGLSDPATYAMSLEALANSGNWYNLYETVMEDGHLIPILFQNYALYARRGALSGFDPSRDNVFYYDLGRTMEDALISE